MKTDDFACWNCGAAVWSAHGVIYSSGTSLLHECPPTSRPMPEVSKADATAMAEARAFVDQFIERADDNFVTVRCDRLVAWMATALVRAREEAEQTSDAARLECDYDLDSKVTKRSAYYYLGGRIETVEEIEARADPKDRILVGNMRCNDWDRVVVNDNSWRTVRPLGKDDVILDVTLPARPEAKP